MRTQAAFTGVQACMKQCPPPGGDKISTWNVMRSPTLTLREDAMRHRTSMVTFFAPFSIDEMHCLLPFPMVTASSS